ncbi:MAG TPA: hypothetical protein VLL97_15055 [Acidobacteriota bacterium]|nr:hypothetical protein [Acidobacteriota bacterium]
MRSRHYTRKSGGEKLREAVPYEARKKEAVHVYDPDMDMAGSGCSEFLGYGNPSEYVTTA